MTTPATDPARDPDEDLYDFEDDDERECFRCGGEGLVECPNPVECTRPHTKDDWSPCASCGGSGDAKDMTIW